MANNIPAGKVTVFYYFGNGAGRLSGTVAAGEIDMKAIVSAANTNAIYGAQSNGGYKSFVPGSGFPSLPTLTPGEGYFVDARASFEMPHVLPHPDPAVQTNAIAFMQGTPATPTPTPSGPKQLNTASPYYPGLKLFYVGEENKELITAASGNLFNGAGGTATFTYPTVGTRKFIESATNEDAIGIAFPAGAATFTDFTMFYHGILLESPSGGHIFASALTTGGDPRIQLGGFLDALLTTNGNARAAVFDTAGDATIFGGGMLSKNTYNSYAFRRTGDAIEFFINGQSAATGTRVAEAIDLTGGQVLIGRNIPFGWANGKAKLQTQAFSLYNRALSNADITAISTNPFAVTA